MKLKKRQTGFSLMEVNIAIFVMAIGILSLVVLYPLGLRESTQGQADLKQSMCADFLLNQAVALASSTNVTWSEWRQWAQQWRPPVQGTLSLTDSSVPSFISSKLVVPNWTQAPSKETQYRMRCCLVPGFSDRVMGIMVVSTEQDALTSFNQYSNNPVYYAEAMFQGNL